MSKQTPIDVSLNPAASRATGFELARPNEPGTPKVDSAFARNRAFMSAGGREGAVARECGVVLGAAGLVGSGQFKSGRSAGRGVDADVGGGLFAHRAWSPVVRGGVWVL